jgi:hypothetical protein
MLARGLPFIPRQEYAEICLISATGEPNHRIAAGCTAPVIQRSSSETIGHASVAGGLTATGMNDAAVSREGPNGTTGSRADVRGLSTGGSRSGLRVMPVEPLRGVGDASISGRRS